MTKLYKIIDDIYQEYSSQYANKLIEKSIMNTIILLVYKNHGIDIKSEFNFRRDSMLSSRILFQIENSIDKYILIDENIIPNVYEYIIYYRKKDKEKLSIYYTPKWIVEYIINNTLLFNKDNINIKDLKILEPSCGGGNFLIFIIEKLYYYYKEKTNFTNKEIINGIVKNNMYGIDMDSNVLEYCKHSLIIKIYKLTGELYNLNFNLINLNFLKEGKLDNINFDYIIGNPPYLENRKINKYYQKDYLKKKYKTAVGRFDIYSLFIEKSIKLLKNNGRIGYIIPGSFLTNNNFSELRGFILDSCFIEKVINLGEKIFKDVDMNMSIIIISRNSYKDLVFSKNISQSNYKKEKLYLKPYRKIKQQYYNELLNNVFDINSSDIIFKMRNRIFNQSKFKIKDYCDIIAGIATGNVRNKLLTTNPDINTKKVLEGKNIYKYNHNWNGLYIRNDRSLIDKTNGEYATFMREDFVYDQKILIRQTADKFICSYDEENFFILNTLYSLIIKNNNRQDIYVKFILALLNSSLLSCIYRSMTMEDGKLFPQIKIFHIKESPLKLVSISEQKVIVKIVDEILQSYKDTKIKFNLQKTYVENRMLRIDDLIYDIYEISNKERGEIERLNTSFQSNSEV
ncbi:N-6 DNA methylase [Clostridium sp. D2Q-14]|uniref:Eco57I restriction-modification methylase domain-containing protein n=1 Tax=Anaeromonas gelatinilytica TaxID=2683194 RepID=UPI00193B6E7D|nr:TaqI-like C-terminal specificity domain-containing protein [Anaeromonas gelatinilytica]MBS4535946.1 N-6 DNA methylase [Anaeromonas gelatinilytica]